MLAPIIHSARETHVRQNVDPLAQVLFHTLLFPLTCRERPFEDMYCFSVRMLDRMFVSMEAEYSDFNMVRDEAYNRDALCVCPWRQSIQTSTWCYSIYSSTVVQQYSSTVVQQYSSTWCGAVYVVRRGEA